MITWVVQRWRDRRGTYRPAGEPIDTSRYEVAAIATDNVAKAFVVQHHYSSSYPAARFRFGLYRGNELAGVAVFSQPMSRYTCAVFPGEPLESCELGRFVLLDDVPANGETWAIARCFELLRRAGIHGVVSFSDPFPRSDANGIVVRLGHVGGIYQASNATFVGRAHPDTIRLLPDGSILSNRAVTKIRGGERGRRYAAAILERHGAAPLGDGDPDAWLAEWLPRLTRKMRHPGNLKYLFGLTRAVKKALPPSLPYPKFSEAA